MPDAEDPSDQVIPPWEAVDGATGGLIRRDETKPDGRRLTRYRLEGSGPDGGTGPDRRP
ncbi:MAG: hypothetical protein M3011_03575 [Actinomycetota bacterium]|nr:hypothetical protein [Actinomycetota bacterium]